MRKGRRGRLVATIPRFLSFACVSLMVASLSYMDSESSRRSSTSWTSKVQLFHHRGSSSNSRSKAAVKSDSSSHDSSSSEFGSSAASCASVSWAVVTPCLTASRSAKPIFETMVRSPLHRLSIWSWSFLLPDYRVREELDESPSNGSEIVFVFSGP